MKSGFPSDKYGEVKKAIKSLISKGFIVVVKQDVKALTLNKKLYSSIEEIVKK